MLKNIKTLLAVAVLSGTMSANVQAATLSNGDTLKDQTSVNTSVEKMGKWNHLITDLIQPEVESAITAKKQNTLKHDETLWDISMEKHLNVSQIKGWNKIITNFIHPGLNQVTFDGLNKTKAIEVKQEEPTAPVLAVQSPTVTKVDSMPTKSATAPTLVKKPEVVVAAVAPGPAPAMAEEVPAQPSTEPSPAPANAEVTPAAAEPTPAPEKVEPAVPVPAPEPAAQAPTESTSAAAPVPAENTSSKEITVKATAYTASCKGCSGITATGINIKANPNEKVIAVDPKVIPLGSKVYVEGFGEATAADTGGAIKGNRIDVFIPSEQDAVNFGVKQLKVTILN